MNWVKSDLRIKKNIINISNNILKNLDLQHIKLSLLLYLLLMNIFSYIDLPSLSYNME